MRRFRQRFSKVSLIFWAALAFLILGLVVVGYGYSLTQSGWNWKRFVEQVYSNLGIELVSISLTVLVIEALNERRTIQERKEELILQMGSPDNSFAIEAVRILRQKGWLTDGSLKGSYLWDANLRDANLDRADLRYVTLINANLQSANLGGANLQGVRLTKANLKGAWVGYTNLREAELMSADFSNTYLRYANLHQA
jgi:Pentapeptide repeats (8 copies)